MTAIRPGSQPPVTAPDRSALLIILAVISSALLLISQESSWLSRLPSALANFLKNPLVASLVLTFFLANLLFAYRWNASLWAKLLVGGLSLFLILPWAGRDNTSVLDLAIQIGIFAALSLGLNIVVGLAGLLDLGYIAFFAVGAYTWGIFGSGQIGKVLTYFKDNSANNGPVVAVGGLVLLIVTALSLRAINRVGGKRTPVANWAFLLAALGLVIGVTLLVRGLVMLAAANASGLTGGVNPNFFWLFLILAIAAAASVGVLIGLPVLKLKGDYLAIITLGLGEVIRVLANNLGTYTNGSQGITPIGSASVPWFNSLAEAIGFTPDQYTLFFLYFVVLDYYRRHHPGQHAARPLQDRAGLDRHPRGRDRRPGDGRAAGADQADRLRHGCQLRGHHGRHLCGQAGLYQPRVFHSQPIDLGAEHGGAGRPGQHSRRDSGSRRRHHPQHLPAALAG